MTVGCTLTCFSDDVLITSISNSSDCLENFPTQMPGGGCTKQVPVQDVKVGELVLTMSLDGKYDTTAVAVNQRHMGSTPYMNMTVKAASGNRSLLVTADHVMVANGHLPEPTLVKAKDLAVGANVLVQGEGHGVVVESYPVVLDHKNSLVTVAGTVLANGVQVTTICDDALQGHTDSRSALQAWQSLHPYSRPELLAM